MIIVQAIDALREELSAWRKAGETVAQRLFRK